MGKKLKNTLLKAVTIDSASSDGKCIARWDDRVVFVEGAAPGDLVDIRIIGKKRNYLEGIVEQLLEPSDMRVDSFCDHFGTCGGCKWQHIDYQGQLKLKRQQVIDSLERIGKLEFPRVNQTLPSASTRYHRNKLEFTFSNRRWLTQQEIVSVGLLDRNGLGFHKPRQFDKIVDINHCYLQHQPSNEIRNWVREYSLEHELGFYDIRKKQGFLRNLVIRTTSPGEVMVILQVGERDPGLIGLMESLKQAFPQITSLYLVVNTKGNETFFDLDLELFHGSEYITEKMGSLEFRIGPKSFYQTNGEQAHEMYKLVKQLADLSGKETVYDLYTGAGTIALFLGSRSKAVVGLEQVPEAIEDARRNAEINNSSNCHFFAGDIKDVLADRILEAHGWPDIVITDPPRAGMHREVVEKIVQIGPNRIIYVSCNPATQARDVALMSEDYEIQSVHPVDMFPHTPHVECVISLDKRQ